MNFRFTTFILLIALLPVNILLYAQPYFNYFITTQEQVDEFQYTIITGALHISGSEVKNLNGLSVLTKVNLLYIDGTAITSLSGLQNLNSFEALVIIENHSLTSTSALNNVTSANNIYISNNNSLTSIEGKNIEGPVSGSTEPRIIEITFNNSLSSIAFPKLSFTRALIIKGNPLLADINGLSGLTHIGEVSGFLNLQVINNTSLNNFCSFYNLFSGEGLIGYYTFSGNGVNPTPAEIIEGGPCPQSEMTIEEIFAALFGEINGLNVNKGIKNSLTVKVTQVFDKYNKHSVNTASNILNAFNNQVNSLYNEGVITEQDRNKLLDLAAGLTNSFNNKTAKELAESDNDNIPDTFTLEQNYPNPFNPSTIIRFSIPEQEFVRVSVFDILGKEVSVLVNAEMQPGIYEYEFKADGLSSGMYLYKITAGNFSSSKKMQLMK